MTLKRINANDECLFPSEDFPGTRCVILENGVDLLEGELTSMHDLALEPHQENNT